MKKLLIIIIFLCTGNSMSTDLSSALEEISITLANLENINKFIKTDILTVQSREEKEAERKLKEHEEALHKSKERIAEIDKDFFNNLEKALYEPTFFSIKKALNALPGRAGTKVALDIIDLLRKDSIEASNEPMFIRYDTLQLKGLSRPSFVSYILLIAKIVETITTHHQIHETISIFSDNIFIEPLLMYLLIFSVHNHGYNSVIVNILPSIDENFTQLNQILKKEAPSCKINKYKTVKDLIDSGNKMDAYITNLTFPQQSNGLLCSNSDPKSVVYKVIAEHSTNENSTYLISSKTLAQKAVRDIIFNDLVKQLANPINKKLTECKTIASTHADLGDIIYSTNKTLGKKVPLFTCLFRKVNTQGGIDQQIRIMESQLNFDAYPYLFAALFKTHLALENKEFRNIAKEFQLFTPDKNDNEKFILLNDDLNNTASTITSFIRTKKLIAPSHSQVD